MKTGTKSKALLFALRDKCKKPKQCIKFKSQHSHRAPETQVPAGLCVCYKGCLITSPSLRQVFVRLVLMLMFGLSFESRLQLCKHHPESPRGFCRRSCGSSTMEKNLHFPFFYQAYFDLFLVSGLKTPHNMKFSNLILLNY